MEKMKPCFGESFFKNKETLFIIKIYVQNKKYYKELKKKIS